MKLKKYFSKRNYACDKCGKHKFKTVVKNKTYQCRACGFIK